METPKDIAIIIAKFGEQELTTSERRKLFAWYRRLDSGCVPPLLKDDVAGLEAKILKKIREIITKSESG